MSCFCHRWNRKSFKNWQAQNLSLGQNQRETGSAQLETPSIPRQKYSIFLKNRWMKLRPLFIQIDEYSSVQQMLHFLIDIHIVVSSLVLVHFNQVSTKKCIKKQRNPYLWRADTQIQEIPLISPQLLPIFLLKIFKFFRKKEYVLSKLLRSHWLRQLKPLL